MAAHAPGGTERRHRAVRQQSPRCRKNSLAEAGTRCHGFNDSALFSSWYYPPNNQRRHPERPRNLERVLWKETGKIHRPYTGVHILALWFRCVCLTLNCSSLCDVGTSSTQTSLLCGTTNCIEWLLAEVSKKHPCSHLHRRKNACCHESLRRW